MRDRGHGCRGREREENTRVRSMTTVRCQIQDSLTGEGASKANGKLRHTRGKGEHASGPGTHWRNMAKREVDTPMSKISNSTTPDLLGLEVWIEILGKRAAEEEVDGKRLVVMEAAEPKVTTPYSIFVKNNSDSDMCVELDMDKKTEKRTYLLGKRRTREFNSFNGVLLGFEVGPLAAKRGTDASSYLPQMPPEFRCFSFRLRAANDGPAVWVPPRYWSDARDDAFGSGSGETSHVGVSRERKIDKKKVELVSAGQAPDLEGYYTNISIGEKLGEFKLHYASVTEMAVARDRRHREAEQAAGKAQHGAAKRKPDNSGGASSMKAEAKGDKETPRKKLKIEKIIDLTADTEV